MISRNFSSHFRALFLRNGFGWRRFAACLLAVLVFAGAAASASAASWTGTLTIANDPTTGSSLTVSAYIPDTGKPIRAAMIMSWAYDDPDWRTVAREFNCLMISTSLNYYQATTDGKKIVALLNAASALFPAHPEIQYTGVILHGWSQASAGACWTAAQPELANRVVAVVNIHETDGLPYQPPLSVPILFMAGYPDGFSKLAATNGIVLGRAALGAPYTMVDDVGHDHVDVYRNYGYVRVWLEEVMKRRLPAVAPATANVVLPGWQNDASAWLGAYDYQENSGVWAAQTLKNVVISSRANWAALKDTRQPIWFPSEWAARVWKSYSQNTRMPDYTDPLPSGTDPAAKAAETAAPVIVTQPQSGTIVSGQPHSFISAVSSGSPVIYRWYRQAAGSSASLVASSANYFNWTPTSADYGVNFYLVATNEFGSVTSNTVTLTLSSTTAAPMLLRRYDIAVEPLDTTASAGETATFSVWAQGTPAPAYQWYKNGTAIAGATGASYTTPVLTISDNGAAYSVVASNSAGSAASRAATLTVNAASAPEITAQPQNTAVYAGQSAAFFVTATGSPAPSFQWQKNGVNIAGATVSQYTVPSAAAGDDGAVYRVVVSNGSGGVTSTAATLSVSTAAVAPTITSQPSNVTVTAGQPATFTVAVTGSPALSYQWYKNNPIVAAYPIAGATSASYTVPAAGYGDTGTFYYAVVSNIAGSANSSPAILTVNIAPAITVQPSNAAVTVGGTATFSVTAIGSALTYKWSRNGSAISGATSSSYTTPAASAADDGAVYTVVVGSGIGLGSVTSIPAILTVNAASGTLSFSTQPSGVTVSVGESATFTAFAPGASVAYQWYRNGAAITGADSASYTAPAASANDNGAVFTVAATSGSSKVTSSPALLSVRSAAPVFQADFNGSGNGIGGSADMVTSGGNGSVLSNYYAWSAVAGGTALAAGGGNYLETIALNPGTQQTARFVPATAANSLAALVSGTVVSGGKAYLVLNGGYDVFARLNQADATPGYQGNWFSVFDNNSISGTRGMRLIFNGQGGGGLRFQIGTGGASAILNYTRTYGSAGSGSFSSAQNAYLDGPGGFIAGSGTTYHVGFTFSTDAAGLVTAKLFGRKDAGAIDTFSGGDLLYAATFQIDAAVVGSAPVGSGTWHASMFSGSAGMGTCADYDSIRLYNTAPASFPALGAPVVSIHPLCASAAAGQSATFSVTASGATGYQWYKNGVAISGATYATYTTPAVSKADNGASYYVVVSNNSGSVMSGAAVLTVPFSAVDLSIVTQPAAIAVYEGQSAAFTVAGQGTSAISYQWKKNGTAIAGATSATYATGSVTLDDSGAAYSVVLTNDAGSVTSGAALLTVYAVPVFEAQFSGSARGTGGVADTVLRGGTGYPGSTATVVYSVIGDPSMGQGNCLRIETAASSLTNQVTAAVFTPATGAGWDVLTGTVTVNGTTYNTFNGGFDFFIRPNTVPAASQSWFRPFDFDARSGNAGLRWILGGGGTSLQFQAVSSVANAFSSGSTVTLSPSFTFATGTVNHVALTFNTSETGVVSVKMFGVAGAGAIETSSTVNLLASGTFQAYASVIGPSPLSVASWSMYERTASPWIATSIDYDSVRLYKKDPKIFPALGVLPYGVWAAPSIGVQPQSLTVAAGQSATFGVTASGVPAPAYQWRKNGVDIAGAASAAYTTAAALPADDGALFSVVVSNTAGSVTSASATLSVSNSYDAWKSRYFDPARQADPAVSGPAASPAGDGISNLLKYACGADPNAAGVAFLPKPGMNGGSGSDYLQLTFRKQKNAPDLSYTVQVSNDLKEWNSGSSETVQVSQSDNGDGTCDVVVQDLLPVSERNQRFIRLRVEQQ